MNHRHSLICWQKIAVTFKIDYCISVSIFTRPTVLAYWGNIASTVCFMNAPWRHAGAVILGHSCMDAEVLELLAFTAGKQMVRKFMGTVEDNHLLSLEMACASPDFISDT